MSQAQLISLAQEYIDRSIEITKRAMEASPFKMNEINEIIMVGGQTRMPAIVEAVNGVLNTTQVQAEQVVDKVFDSIVASLKKGEEVSIAGLGIFSVKARAARDARNPRTGETVKVPAMNVPKFRAAKALKDAVK
jgi:DNA-binding protein HU-beta